MDYTHYPHVYNPKDPICNRENPIYDPQHPLHQLHTALHTNDVDTIQKLMDLGGSYYEYCGCYPIHTVVQHGYLDLIGLFKSIANKQNRDGSTALHIAVYIKNKRMVVALLELGAEPNIQDYRGNTALHLNVFSLKIGKLLLNYGGNPLIENNDRRTPKQQVECSLNDCIRTQLTLDAFHGGQGSWKMLNGNREVIRLFGEAESHCVITKKARN